MKKIILTFMLSLGSLLGQSNMVDLSSSSISTARIYSSSSQCDVDIDSIGSINTSCYTAINSRGYRIFCTRGKRVCKTLDEVRGFLFGSAPDTSTPNSSYQSCIDNATNNYAMKMCASGELEYQDGLLNMYYQEAMGRLSRAERQKLRKAQRAWIGYRDSKCESEGRDMRGGTGESLLIVDCKADETKKRAVELKTIY